MEQMFFDLQKCLQLYSYDNGKDFLRFVDIDGGGVILAQSLRVPVLCAFSPTPGLQMKHKKYRPLESPWAQRSAQR
jgi:hypothetical protein